MFKKVFLFFASLTLSSCALLGTEGSKYEESPYTVLEEDGNIQLRDYPSMIVAEVTVEGNYENFRNKAFRLLAGYIFGNNISNKEIAMTTPVTMSEETSEAIAMTAPVSMSESSSSEWTMQFMMPSQYKKVSDLPTPKDSQIKLKVLPSRKMAVIRYSYFMSESKNLKKLKTLEDWLATKSIATKGKPEFTGYDPPWTIPFFRRNEVRVEVSIK